MRERERVDWHWYECSLVFFNSCFVFYCYCSSIWKRKMDRSIVYFCINFSSTLEIGSFVDFNIRHGAWHAMQNWCIAHSLYAFRSNLDPELFIFSMHVCTTSANTIENENAPTSEPKQKWMAFVQIPRWYFHILKRRQMREMDGIYWTSPFLFIPFTKC